MLDLGIIAFSLAVLFQLVTLPVEFNASGRAIRVLESTGIFGNTELKYTKKVLGAAALTYVAACSFIDFTVIKIGNSFWRKKMTTSKPVNQVNLRNIVLEMLLKVNKGEKSHVALKSTLDKNVSLDKHQRSFITRLFQGTLERRIELDFIINQFSKTPVNKMKPVIREILRMGVYQIKYMDNVPVSAVCNEG